MTDKIDFKTEIAAYRARRGRFSVVDVPDLRYLMIDGHGDPNAGRSFTEATEALYPLAYRMKFLSKPALARDYVVMPLEGLWWADDMNTFTSARDKSRWDWTLMIMTPDWITTGRSGAPSNSFASSGTGAWTTADWRPCPRGGACRHSMSAPTTTRRNCCGRCMRSTSRITGSRWSAGTTRSTSAIHGESNPRSCGPFCGSRSPRPDRSPAGCGVGASLVGESLAAVVHAPRAPHAGHGRGRRVPGRDRKDGQYLDRQASDQRDCRFGPDNRFTGCRHRGWHTGRSGRADTAEGTAP